MTCTTWSRHRSGNNVHARLQAVRDWVRRGSEGSGEGGTLWGGSGVDILINNAGFTPQMNSAAATTTQTESLMMYT